MGDMQAYSLQNRLLYLEFSGSLLIRIVGPQQTLRIELSKIIKDLFCIVHRYVVRRNDF